MTFKTLQDLLPFVEQPSRYLGTEVNSIRKDHRRVDLRIALAFPDLYEIGTSHFGIQILYSILNRQEAVVAERVYAPGVDMENHLRASHIPLMSMESHTPVNRFDIIGFSLLYELNYTNILTILDLSGIPFLSQKRDRSHPFIIAGGPSTCNPEPVAEIFDAIVIGDGEAVILEMAGAWLEWKGNSCGDREALLKAWSRIEGVYVPSLFRSEFTAPGFQILSPRSSHHQRVTRALVDNLDKTPFPDTPIIPYGKPVHDRLRLEVARGCTRGCRFCQAGMIYRPVRERSPETLLSQAETSLAATGYGNLSLLSLSTGDYGCIVPFMEQLMARCEANRIAVSLPSLRVETLTPKLMKLIKQVRKTGFTIAPEAGSQRLRNGINKNITETDIHQTVEAAFRLGWRAIKLYFMVGLPTETDEDIQALVDLVRELRKKHRKRGQLNVSVATFIPKAHTPFQWVSQISLAESTEKIGWAKAHLKVSGVHFKWQNPEMSILEGLWARGDRRLSRLLISAYEKGCRFDGWSDHFRFRLWEEALSDTGIDMDFYTTRARNLSEPLPWDHIDIKVSKLFLQNEWEKALSGDHTPDCRNGACCTCGVCDFTAIRPMVFNTVQDDAIGDKTDAATRQPGYRRLKVSYAKKDQAKYFGHLELKNIIFRALRRAGIPVKYSEGFHPMLKVSFEDPLPIGMESDREAFYVTVQDYVKPAVVHKRLNEHLPDGLIVIDCHFSGKKGSLKKSAFDMYQVILKDGFFDEKPIDCLKKSTEWLFTRKTRNGRIKKIDLKELVANIHLQSPGILEMTLRSEPGKTVRPAEVIANLFGFSDDIIKQARIIKRIDENS